jgi:formate-dependent nitrite reductase membrane component NrfD
VQEAYSRRWEGEGRKRKRSDAPEPEQKPGYYGIPAIHGSHWNWLVIFYFFLGGISAASHVIAAIAHLVGGEENRPIARAGRYISFLALLPCPLLLIRDLGRPERFLNMLRVVKLRSPMSLGSWGLSAFGAFSTLVAMVQAAQDGLFGRSRAARMLARVPTGVPAVVGSGPAFFVGGYTGVLLGATAVPLWGKNALLLGPLFLNSAFSTAVAAINLGVAIQKNPPELAVERLEALDRIVIGSELALVVASRAHLGELARPLKTGRTGMLLTYGTGVAGLITPLAIQSVNRRLRSRPLSVLASLLVLFGGFVLRYTMVTGGHESANDPEATFFYTRKKS